MKKDAEKALETLFKKAQPNNPTYGEMYREEYDIIKRELNVPNQSTKDIMQHKSGGNNVYIYDDRSAKEMFEELGYEYECDGKIITYTLKQEYNDEIHKKYNVGSRTFGVSFNIENEDWHSWIVGHDLSGNRQHNLNMKISKELHQAISKQLKELQND